MPTRPLTHRQRQQQRVKAHRPPSQRPKNAAQGLGNRWTRLSKAYRSRHPFCVECERHGRMVQAQCVDHIVPRSQGGTDSEDNLQSLCWSHHSKKTRLEENGNI